MKISTHGLSAFYGLVLAVAAATCSPPATVGRLNLLRATTKDVSEALRDGNVTSVELVRAYLARIKANNIHGKATRLVALIRS